jgi:hypothetical protein
LKNTGTKGRLRSYFDRVSKPLPIASIAQQFSDVNLATLNYNLQSLLEAGVIFRPKRGVYQRNAAYQGPEEKRKVVDQHIATNGSRIQKGALWKPGMEALTETVNPLMHSFLGFTFGESIIERMKVSGFTDADVRFVESLLSRVYPLSAEQKKVVSG